MIVPLYEVIETRTYQIAASSAESARRLVVNADSDMFDCVRDVRVVPGMETSASPEDKEAFDRAVLKSIREPR